MGSLNCQQTFVVRDGYVSARLPGAGCPITLPGTYAVALRTASSTLPTGYNYWAVDDNGAGATLAGGWTYQSCRVLSGGRLSAASAVASLQITATF